MLITLYIFICLLAIYKMKVNIRGYYEDFMDKDQTESIKGIFILFVFIRHILQYITSSGYEFNCLGNHLFYIIDGKLDQLIVASFLFYSGYGISESVKKKGPSYVKEMPIKRIAPTLLNFDIAVLFFIVLCFIINKPISISQCLSSLTGWNSVGNSNWYIFDIIICYSISYIAYLITFLFQFKKNYIAPALISILILLFIVILAHFKSSHWYNTLFCFPMGIIFSSYKKHLISMFKEHYMLAQIVMVSLFTLLFLFPHDFYSLKFNLTSVLFVHIILLLTMKIKINNAPLKWLGVHLFPIYIYQRIPMIFIYNYIGPHFIKNSIYLYIFLCFILTILIAKYYKHWQIK